MTRLTRKTITIASGVAVGVLALGTWAYYVGIPALVHERIEAMTQRSAPRLVAGEGEYQGAAYCATCHPRQVEDWRGSLHAQATTEASYGPRYGELSWAMSLERCDGCHAPTSLRQEGVSCEVCHGPGRTEKIARDICRGCHQVNSSTPVMEPLSTGREFETSKAHAAGLDCVACHMAARRGRSFHGFSGSRTTPSVYSGVVSIQSVERKAGTLVVTVKNNVAGHSLPTGAPENIVFLTAAGFNAQGEPVYTREYRFEKHMFRFRRMPMITMADTRLTDGETRALEFSVPQAVRVEVTLAIRPILWTGEQVEQVVDQYVGTGR